MLWKWVIIVFKLVIFGVESSDQCWSWKRAWKPETVYNFSSLFAQNWVYLPPICTKCHRESSRQKIRQHNYVFFAQNTAHCLFYIYNECEWKKHQARKQRKHLFTSKRNSGNKWTNSLRVKKWSSSFYPQQIWENFILYGVYFKNQTLGKITTGSDSFWTVI